MELKVTDFLETIGDEPKYPVAATTVKKAPFIKDMNKVVTVATDYIKEQLTAKQVAVYQIEIAELETVIRLETNLINMPIDEPKRVQKLIGDEEQLPLNVYVVIKSPFINQSQLRIDLMASGDEVVANSAEVAIKITDYLQAKMTIIEEQQQMAADEPKE